MPLLIITGVPKPIGLRHKYYQPSLKGWDLFIVPSPLNHVSVKATWEIVLDIADKAKGEGTHIFAFHNPEQEYKKFNATIYGRHRLVWLNKDMLRIYGTNDFDKTLQQYLDFEQDWRNHLRPVNYRDPLILPEKCFIPKKSPFNDMWRRAQEVNSEKDLITRIKDMKNNFKDIHYINGKWQDKANLIFDPDGARHAIAELRARWKYTYQVPHDFHFDVRDSKGNKFNVRDNTGRIFTFNQYTNIDCQGAIRAGN